MRDRNRNSDLTPELKLAVSAALDKKAQDLVVLDLRGLASFTDYFLICHGSSSRQAQTIADEISERLEKEGRRGHMEGHSPGEWILIDYSDFVVHVFTGTKREFFNLERLWGDAPVVRHEGEDPPPAARRHRRSPTPANA